MSILLAEDTPVHAQLIRTLLQSPIAKIAFGLAHVSCLADGLQHLSRLPVDAVLLDLSLPDSEAVTEVVRLQHAADVPIVVLTGSSDEQLKTV